MLGLALRNASRGVGVGPFAGNDPVGVVENRAGLRPWIAPVDSIKNPIRVIEWIGLGWVVGSAPGAGPILGLHVSIAQVEAHLLLVIPPTRLGETVSRQSLILLGRVLAVDVVLFDVREGPEKPRI